MFKLLLKLMMLPPELLKVHAQGYADLATQAWAQYLYTVKKRWMLYAFSALSLLLALIFGGMSLLLWSALPQVDASHQWVLLGLPLTLLFMSGLFWAWARSLLLLPVLQEIKEQIKLDLLAIRQVKVS